MTANSPDYNEYKRQQKAAKEYAARLEQAEMMSGMLGDVTDRITSALAKAQGFPPAPPAAPNGAPPAPSTGQQGGTPGMAGGDEAPLQPHHIKVLKAEFRHRFTGKQSFEGKTIGQAKAIIATEGAKPEGAGKWCLDIVNAIWSRSGQTRPHAVKAKAEGAIDILLAP